MTRATLNDRLAAHFKAHPGRYIEAHELFTVAGSLAWRTRVSQLRVQRHMDIKNLPVLYKAQDGAMKKLSYYIYLPPAEPQQMTLHEANQ